MSQRPRLAVLLQLPAGQQQKTPYILTVVPPFILAALFPQIFFKVSCAWITPQNRLHLTGSQSLMWLSMSPVQALDFAGTYGVLSLFGLIPAASVWSQRYGANTRTAAFRVRCQIYLVLSISVALLPFCATCHVSTLAAGSSWWPGPAACSRIHSWRHHSEPVHRLNSRHVCTLKSKGVVRSHIVSSHRHVHRPSVGSGRSLAFLQILEHLLTPLSQPVYKIRSADKLGRCAVSPCLAAICRPFLSAFAASI